MTTLKRVFSLFFFSAISPCFLIPSQSFGWGKDGHQNIEMVAVSLMPASPLTALLKNNMEAMKFLCMVPDFDWKHGQQPEPLEGQAHFFNLDFYLAGGSAVSKAFPDFYKKFDREVVLKNGTAPWRMNQLSVLLVQAMKRKIVDPIEVIQLAAILGHYTGDLSNSLHVAKDYDGDGVGVPGLHSFFESVTVKEIDPKELFDAVRAEALPSLSHIPNNVSPIDGAFNLAIYAHSKTAGLLADAKQYKLTPALQKIIKPLIIRTLANASAVLAKIWYEAWVVAGKPDIDTTNKGYIAVPPWVPMTYLPRLQ